MKINIKRTIAVIALALFATLNVACATNPVTGRQELHLVSDETANEMGSAAYPQVRQEWGGDYNDPALQRYVSTIGQSMVKVSHSPELPFQFKVTNDSRINAITLPGGKIFITRQMLAELKNEAQLAAVLGHEIGHATARHGQAAMSRGILTQVAAAVAVQVVAARAETTQDQQIGLALVQAGIIGVQLVQLGYSRDQETQSDELGAVYMAKAGYNPEGAVQVQQFLAGKSKGGSGGWLAEMTRSHPVSEKRVKHIRDYVYKIQPEFSNMQKGDGLFAKRYIKMTRGVRKATNAANHLESAKKALLAKNEPLAKKEIDEAIKIDPRQAELYIFKGDMLYKRKDYKNAKRLYRRAAKLEPKYYKPWSRLALIAKAEGDNKKMIEYNKKATKLHPGYSKGYLDNGYAQLKQGNYLAASQNLEAATAIDGSNGEDFIALGMSYDKQGRKDDAANAYRAGIARNPSNQSRAWAEQRANKLSQ